MGVVDVDVIAGQESATALADVYLAAARAYPERPALWIDGDWLTYRDLLESANRIAGTVAATTAPGDRCALLASRSTTAYAGVLGALLAGATYVPLNPAYPLARLHAILEACNARVLVVDSGSLAAAKSLIAAAPQALILLLPDVARPPDWASRFPEHQFFCRSELVPMHSGTPRTDRETGAYLLFTSGSTGAPKGVVIRQRNVLAYIENVRARYQPAPQDRFSQLFELSFDLSVHDMFVCWSAGACLYVPPAHALARLNDFVRRHELTCWFSVPSTAAYMARLRMLAPGSFPSLRLSLFCGEALPTRLARQWQAAAPNSRVENLYGPTEATIAITAYRLAADAILEEDAPVPIGWPFPGQHVAVIGADGHLAGDQEPGELCLAGTQVADGYWCAPEITAQCFRPPKGLGADAPRHWYRTGDRAIMDPIHGLRFLGRIDHQAKIRGYRIDLLEVETVVRAATGSASVAALAWPADATDLARHVVVFVAGEAVAADIIAHCKRKLPPVMVPHQVRIVPEWPVNANGKTDYGVLKQKLKDEPC